MGVLAVADSFVVLTPVTAVTFVVLVAGTEWVWLCAATLVPPNDIELIRSPAAPDSNAPVATVVATLEGVLAVHENSSI